MTDRSKNFRRNLEYDHQKDKKAEHRDHTDHHQVHTFK
tara:strand:- start:419 stop:532 length:114 start_codon:yes stop_codon:yes gene_type:complete